MKKTNLLTATLCAVFALSCTGFVACKDDDVTPPDPAPTATTPTKVLGGSFGVDADGAFISTETANAASAEVSMYAQDYDDTEGLYTYVLKLDVTCSASTRYFFISDYEQEYGTPTDDEIEWEIDHSYAFSTTANTPTTFYIRFETMFTTESYDYEVISLPDQTAAMGENKDKVLHFYGDWKYTFVAPAAGQYKIVPDADSEHLRLGIEKDNGYIDYYADTNGVFVVTATQADQAIVFYAKTVDEGKTTAGFTISEYVPEKYPASYTLNREGADSVDLDIIVKAGGSTNIVIQDKALCSIAWTDASLTYHFNGMEITDTTTLLFAGENQGSQLLTVTNNGATDAEQTITLRQLSALPTGTHTVYLPSYTANRQFLFDNVNVETAMRLTVDENVAAIYKGDDETALSELIVQAADGTISVRIASKTTSAVLSTIEFVEYVEE